MNYKNHFDSCLTYKSHMFSKYFVPDMIHCEDKAKFFFDSMELIDFYAIVLFSIWC